MDGAPVTVPGGKPVTALPGLTPRFPFTTVGVAVLVTVEPPSTAKVLSCAVAWEGPKESAANPDTKTTRVSVTH